MADTDQTLLVVVVVVVAGVQPGSVSLSQQLDDLM